MQKKITLLFSLILLCSFSQLQAQLDTVNLAFTPVDGGDVVTVGATVGSYGFMVDGVINLIESTEYQLSISLASEDASFRARSEELQFFFIPSTEELLIGDVNYDDMDSNNLPIGFNSILTTECKETNESGLFQIVLKDLGNSKSENSTMDDGTKLLDVTWVLNVVNDPDAPACENEEEIITDVILTFTPTNGGSPIVAKAQDPDGEGVLGLEILDDIKLGTNTEYNMAITVTNSVEGEDITAEIKEEDDEHMFFFEWTAGVFSNPNGNGNADNRSDAVNYLDFDENNNPVGLSTNWTTSADATTGAFRLILKHQPGSKTADSGANIGSTDLDLSWNIETTVQQVQLDTVNLAFTPVDGGDIVNAGAIMGPNGFIVDGGITLIESTEYELSINLASEDAELRARSEELQFFFSASTEELLIGEVGYNDMDSNNLPVGFNSKLTTECKETNESGLFQIVLKDLGNSKSENSTMDDGTKLFDISWTLIVVDDPDAPDCENEEEIITDVVLTFTPINGGDPIVAKAQDPDGEGVLGLEILDDIKLGTNTEYNMAITVTNSVEGEDITEEIREEDDEHMFFFEWTAGIFSNPSGDGNADNRSDAVNYLDFDENNQPVGLSTNWTTTGDITNGTFRLILKHQPGLKSANSSASDGGTDIDLSWNIETSVITSIQEQLLLNQALNIYPNPAQDQLLWTLDNATTEKVQLSIFNNAGQLISQPINNGGLIDVSTLTKGIYFLQVKTEQTIRTARFVKTD